MDTAPKDRSRSRRSRSAPPLGQVQSSLPPTLLPDVEVPRFPDQQAPLAALAAQVKNASDPADKASAAGRLARQLVHRGIEIREAITLAEKSLSLREDPELGCELASWWVSAGDPIRGAALLQTHSESLSLDRRKTALLEVAKIYARAGQARQAHQALRQVVELAPGDPKPFEVLGSLGFWSDLASSECARAYLKAAEFRLAAGEDAAAFENRLRAFEVDPGFPEAATKLAAALRKRGRPGAADEILREHLRRGTASHRAAHHQRVFYGAFSEGNLARALESAFEAELDIELDPDRLSRLLTGEVDTAIDFESFLVYLAKDGELGDAKLFGQWLLALVDVHRRTWGDERTDALGKLVTKSCGVEPLPVLEQPQDESRLRSLRQQLGSEMSPEERLSLREEIARRECALGHWEEAFEVFEPLLGEARLSLEGSVLGIVIAGRARQPVARARALSAFGACLPTVAGAVAHAVASETLLAHGLVDEARLAAKAAVESEPTSERALASQALVALSAPEEASAGLLERSLSVLVARSDACAVLCRSASRRGADRLGLTWAARGFALRPGDALVAGRYLRQAILAKDGDKLVEAMSHVLAQPMPLTELTADLARAVQALTDLAKDPLVKVGPRLLNTLGVRSKDVTDALIDAAKRSGSAEILAAITERQLIVAPQSERSSLSLLLCRQRLRAAQPMAAARALRRALSQGANWSLVQEALSDFDETLEPDGVLALMEVRVDRLAQETREQAEAKARELRRVGAARWDMAQDLAGAVQLWLRAADLDPDRGLDLFAHFLRTMVGGEAAAKQLQLVAEQSEDPKRSGKLLGLSAREMLRLERPLEAYQLAREALQRAPLMTELLAVVETAATAEQLDELESLYWHLSKHSLGRYGQRAIHYSAARQFEKRGRPELALAHACAAFEAVPAEGVAFVLMARLADTVAGHAALAAAVDKAADQAENDDERARWLAKAAALADNEAMGRRQRAEILLRAAQMVPERPTIESLLDALAHFLADEPAARDEMWARYVQVSREILRHAAGAHGAELNLVIGKAGTTHFEQPDYTLERLAAAIECDIEVPDYADLLPLVNQLAGLVEQAEGIVEKVRARIQESGSPLGRGLAELAGKMAELLGDTESQTELLVRAASDFPEDVQLVALARAAATRDNRQDLLGLIEGFLPATERAHLVLERLGSLSAEEGLDALLDLDLDSAPPELRIRLLELLSERQEQVGRLSDAALSYRELYALAPDNVVALKGVERDAERKGDYEELCQILQRRIELNSDAGEVRRLKLRRATVLETRLGRASEARAVLSEMIAEQEDRAVLRMLADSWQRSGDHTEAAELWQRVHRIAEDEVEADDAAYRAAACYVESGTPRRAAEALSEIRRPTTVHRKLGLEVARSLKDKAATLDQLIGLAEVTVGDNQEAGRLFMEAARLCLKAQDYRRAERCAYRASEMMPNSADVRFLLARMRARRSPPKDMDTARDLQEQLMGTEDLGGATEREIHSYLSAQVIRHVESLEAARRLLETAIEEQGKKPLLALGLADLLKDDPEQAIELYEHAVGGELHGFCGEGEILFKAGRLARELGDYGRARGLISAIPENDSMHPEAAKELEEIALEEAQVKRDEAEQSALESASKGAKDGEADAIAAGDASVEAQSEEGRRSEPRKEERRRVQAEAEAIREAARQEHRRASQAVIDTAEQVPSSRSAAAIGAFRSVATEEEPDELDESEHREDVDLIEDFEPTGSVEVPSPESEPIVVEERRSHSPSRRPEQTSRSDEELVSLLENGDIPAGLELLERLQEHRSRSRDAVVVAQHLAALDPGDASLLGRLVTTAARDGNDALALAVRHVLGAYGSGDSVVAPSPQNLRENGEAAQALLRHACSPANEAIALVWEHSHGLYKRELSQYGLEGLERLPLNAATPLGEMYTAAARLLSRGRTPVFLLDEGVEINMQVALLVPPAVIIEGQVTEVSPELSYHFGAMLTATAPEHALLFGSTPEEMQHLLEALSLSFGSGNAGSGHRPSSDVTRVASFFWETIPPRAQRRLSQLCADPAEFSFASLASASRRVLRRAGLIVCGDLPTAIADACLESGLEPPRHLAGLAQCAAQSPAVADLLGLALSPEYAELRFRDTP